MKTIIAFVIGIIAAVGFTLASNPNHGNQVYRIRGTTPLGTHSLMRLESAIMIGANNPTSTPTPPPATSHAHSIIRIPDIFLPGPPKARIDLILDQETNS